MTQPSVLKDDEEMIAYGKGKRMPLSLYKIRHSLAHIMAQAVTELFPQAKPTIGPLLSMAFTTISTPLCRLPQRI